MDRAATDLAARDHDLAAVLLEHAGRRRVGLGKHRVGDAAEEEARPAPASARSAGRTSGSVPCEPPSFGSIACMRRRVGGSRRVSPIRSAQSSSPSRCSSRAGASASLTRPRIRKQVMENQPLEQAGLLAPGRRALRARS